MRLVVPGRRRRAGLGGLTAALVLAAGCGGGDEPQRPAATAPAAPAAIEAPPEPPRFAIGVDERNPHLLDPAPQPEPYGRFRDALHALEPTYVRVLVDWSVYQPAAGRPPEWTLLRDGCARGVPPCADWRGIRDVLRAVRAMGATPVLQLYGTPAWAARPPAGCEREDVAPYARMPRLDAYRAMVRSLAELVRREGLRPYWSPWNEPNLPVFLNPQRGECDIGAPSLADDRYAELVRVAADELGLGRLLVGEASGITRHTRATGAAELARTLPDELVCGAAAWSQHAYLTAPRDEARRLEVVDPGQRGRLIARVKRALASHGCRDRVPIWITETGAGDRGRACEDVAAQLRRWRRDPQVQAVFQYTFRTDPFFPVGLADAELTRLFPAYEAWRTRGATDCR